MVRRMFEDEPMAPVTWAVLQQMTDQSKSASKWGIVNLVVHHAEGTWLDGPDVAELTAGERKWAARPLKQLVAARVLDCDDGGGGHQRWYRVNPRWWQWKIRWAHRCSAHQTTAPESLGSCSDCRSEVKERLAQWEQRVQQSPIDRFISRPGSAFSRVIALLKARFADDEVAQKALDTTISRSKQREITAAGGNPTKIRAAIERDLQTNRAAIERDFEDPPEEEEEISSPRDDGNSSSSGSAPAPVVDIGRKRRTLTTDEEKARSAVLARCVGQAGRRPFLKGWPADDLYELVARYGAVEISAAAAQIPSGMELPPRFVELLADVLAARASAGGSEPASESQCAAPSGPPPLVLADKPLTAAPAPETPAGQYAERAAERAGKVLTQRTKTG